MTYRFFRLPFILRSRAARLFKPLRVSARRGTISSILILFAYAANIFVPSPVSAAPVVDQQNLGAVTGNVGYLPNLSRGQSFTVGIDGTLAGFEFQFNKSSQFATGNAYLSIYSTDIFSGGPDILIGQATLAAADVSTAHMLTYFDLTSLNISVSTGDLMFAALDADFGGGMHSTRDVYSGGTEWGCGPALGIACWTQEDNGISDLVFRSHVISAIPETGAVGFLALGLAGMGAARRWNVNRCSVALKV